MAKFNLTIIVHLVPYNTVAWQQKFCCWVSVLSKVELIVPWALMLCLIYTHLRPRVSAYIYMKKLRRDPRILEEYTAIIREQLNMRIIKSIEQPDTTRRIHYLPHHAIVRQDKDTTKVRIVYDASAYARGPSLNQCLHTGPRKFLRSCYAFSRTQWLGLQTSKRLFLWFQCHHRIMMCCVFYG